MKFINFFNLNNSTSFNLRGLYRWCFSTNHKDIGTLYLLFAIFAGIIGTSFSIMMRMELSGPGNQFFEGDYQLFNVVVTAHGFIMVFF